MSNELDLEVVLPAAELADILDRIAAGMRRGMLRVRASHRQVELQPPSALDMRLEPYRNGLELSLSWAGA